MKNFKQHLLSIVLLSTLNNGLTQKAQVNVNNATSLKNKGFSDVAKKVLPGTVSINVFVKETRNDQVDLIEKFLNDPYFRKFFGIPESREDLEKKMKKTPRAVGVGSGFIISQNGYVVTNRHVIQNADEVTVTINTGENYKAKVVYEAEFIDIAFLKITADDANKKFSYLELGDSAQIERGDFAIAFGAPYGFSNSMTLGIVSASERNVNEFIKLGMPALIQTDAAINRGNSGGPLVDIDGKVMGINSMIVSQTKENSGMGFAIPVNLIKKMAEKIVKDGEFKRGYLGVEVEQKNVVEEEEEQKLLPNTNVNVPKGARVARVTKSSPADLAGIQVGDIILKVDGRPIENYLHLNSYVSVCPAGDEVNIMIKRGKKETKILRVRLGEKGKVFAETLKGQKEVAGMTLSVPTKDIIDRLGYNSIPSKGVIVIEIKDRTQAHERGIRVGDIIIEVNSTSIKSPEEFLNVYNKVPKGKGVLLTIENPTANGIYKKFIAIEKE